MRALESGVVLSAKTSTLSCMSAASTLPEEHAGAAQGLPVVENIQVSSLTGVPWLHLSEDFPEYDAMLLVHCGSLILLLVSQVFPLGGIFLEL